MMNAASLHTWSSSPGEWMGPACPQYVLKSHVDVPTWMWIPVTGIQGTLFKVSTARGEVLMDVRRQESISWSFVSLRAL